MIINILNDNLQKIAETDEYTSLICCKRYNEIGALDLQVEANKQNILLYKKGYFITLKGHKNIYKINAIEINTQQSKDNSLIVGAVDCLSILNQRINMTYSYKNENGQTTNLFNGSFENYIRKLINDNIISPQQAIRQINNFQLTESKGFAQQIEAVFNFVNVGEEVLKVCKTYKCGCEVIFENGVFYFNLYNGLDRSIEQSDNNRIVFSPTNDNLISSKYSVDTSNYKNAVIPYNSKNETQNKFDISWFNTANATLGSVAGLQRDELLVDVQDVIDTNGFSNLFKSSIAETKEKTTFEGEVFSDSYVYNKDYNLGDIVTVQNEFGITAKARIIEVCETWDNSGYSLEPIFEYEEIEEVDFSQVALLTENNIPMTTENGVMLLSEDMISENGVKISELQETTEIKDGCCLPIVQDGLTKKVYYSTIKQDITPDFEIDQNGHLLAKYSE